MDIDVIIKMSKGNNTLTSKIQKAYSGLKEVNSSVHVLYTIAHINDKF
ncbi:hypothetical protein cpx_00005 [Clostridium phage cpx]|nr:hypothetical protein cpx_00005 [Clostridium phage cpx]